jgi:hypothetical protein
LKYLRLVCSVLLVGATQAVFAGPVPVKLGYRSLTGLVFSSHAAACSSSVAASQVWIQGVIDSASDLSGLSGSDCTNEQGLPYRITRIIEATFVPSGPIQMPSGPGCNFILTQKYKFTSTGSGGTCTVPVDETFTGESAHDMVSLAGLCPPGLTRSGDVCVVPGESPPPPPPVPPCFGNPVDSSGCKTETFALGGGAASSRQIAPVLGYVGNMFEGGGFSVVDAP